MPGFPPRQQASTLRVRCGKACIVPYLPYMFMSYLYLSTDQTLSIKSLKLLIAPLLTVTPQRLGSTRIPW